MSFTLRNCFYNSSIERNSYCLVLPDVNSMGTSNSRISGHRFVFNDGWRPLFIFKGLEGFSLLELEYHHGERATWILDQDLSFLANDWTNLTANQSRRLSRAGKPLLSADHGSNLWHDFSELNDSVRRDLMRLAFDADAVARSATLVAKRPVAICFSGHSRAFLHYSAYWREFLETINDEFDLRIFYHTWADTGFVKSVNGNFKEGTYETVAFTAIDDLNHFLNPTSFCIESGSSSVNLAAKAFSSVYLNERQAAKKYILSQIYSVEQADRLRQDHDERHVPSVAVMRMRFDLVPADSSQAYKVRDEMRYIADNPNVRIIFGTNPNYHRHPGGGGGCQVCDMAFRAAGMPNDFSMPRHDHSNDICDLHALGSPAAMALYASLFTNAQTIWSKVETQSKSPAELGVLPYFDDDNPNDKRILLDGDQTENGLHCFYPEKLLRFHLQDVAVVNSTSEFHILRR